MVVKEYVSIRDTLLKTPNVLEKYFTLSYA
jgi:hypothetical protein